MQSEETPILARDMGAKGHNENIIASAIHSLPACKNGNVRRAGKSVIRMLLQGDQMTVGGLQLSSSDMILVRDHICVNLLHGEA